MFTGKRVYALSALAFFLFTLAATSLFALPNDSRQRTKLLGLSSLNEMEPNGMYRIQLLDAGKWREVGSISYDKFFRERTITVGPINAKEETVKLRLVQKGGGAAHIDSVSLGGGSPLSVIGPDEKEALKKLSKTDYDVLDAFGKTLELTFKVPEKDRTLKLLARVEAPVISTTPFQFPRGNLYRPMNNTSRFYSYRLDAQKGSLTIDGSLEEVTSQKPFFKEYSHTGSGHPPGFAYGWVCNDEEHLYVAMDFTSDNTMDGDKDYGKVYAKTPEGLKEFKVSMKETAWGAPGFTYTDKVAYQHKVYEFRIPLKELGATGPDRPGEVQLAFSLYGTASPNPGNSWPSMAYDPVNNRYLVVFMNEKVVGKKSVDRIYGQMVDPDGNTLGAKFLISKSNTSAFNPSVAYDSVNKRFLVAWGDYGTGADMSIHGQLIDIKGKPYGKNMVISNAPNGRFFIATAYDSSNQRFLVVWHDTRSGSDEIYGQIVNADGTLFGTAPDANLPISVGTGAAVPSVAFDSVNHRYLVAFAIGSTPGTGDILGQMVGSAGEITETAFPICDAAGDQYSPSVAFDPNGADSRFLVAWEDNRGIDADIYGQVIDASGTFTTSAFVISGASDYQVDPSVAADTANHRFMVAWMDFRNPGGLADIYGQLVTAGGTLSGDNFPVNLDGGSQGYACVAWNSVDHSFLTTFTTNDAGVQEIAFGLVVPTTKVKLLTPSGNTWASGSPQTIRWAAPDTAASFKVKYSLNKGRSWTEIPCTTCLTGSQDWSVPMPAGNTNKNLIKVEGYDASSNLINADKSRTPFTIEVVKLTSPNGYDSYSSGSQQTVTWTTNTTIRPVDSATILYTTNGGAWKKAEKLTGNPGTYTWTVPTVTKTMTKCKVRVQLRDAKGALIGTDDSDDYFQITP